MFDLNIRGRFDVGLETKMAVQVNWVHGAQEDPCVSLQEPINQFYIELKTAVTFPTLNFVLRSVLIQLASQSGTN